jgi:hypothetical protein
MVRVGVGANACGAWFINAGVASQITTSSRRVRSGHITRVSIAGTGSSSTEQRLPLETQSMLCVSQRRLFPAQ